MFALPAVTISAKHRASGAHFLSEVIATLGLLVIFALARSGRARSAPAAVGTGAVPVRPPIGGLSGPDALGPADGVHLLHSMGDTFGAPLLAPREVNPVLVKFLDEGTSGIICR
jgi:hypothetical protein